MKEMNPGFMEAFHRVERMGRRDFLKASAMAAGLWAATALVRPNQAIAAVPEGVVHLSVSEVAFFEHLVRVALPTEGSNLVPTEKIPVLQTLDAALLGTMAPHILEGLKGGIAYFNDGPLERFGKRFVELSLHDARAFCDEWADSAQVPHRALSVGLKKLIGLAYWANPPTWAPLGYDGPVTDKWNLKSLGNSPLPSA